MASNRTLLKVETMATKMTTETKVTQINSQSGYTSKGVFAGWPEATTVGELQITAKKRFPECGTQVVGRRYGDVWQVEVEMWQPGGRVRKVAVYSMG